MGVRRAEAAEKRKQRIEENDRDKRIRESKADEALDDMVKRSIEKHGAVDTTFVQFYPTLMPIAEQKKTLSAAYLAGVSERTR